MKKYICLTLVTLLLAACSHQSDTTMSKGSNEARHSGLILNNMDTSVRPGDDFNAYVNGAWLASTDIPSDKSSFGIAYMLHETAQENVKTIIEESSSGRFASGSDEQKVGDLFNSYMDMDTRNELGLAPLAPELARIAALQTHDDVAAYFGEANKIG
ncbi:MAG: peptidase M13, partial [Pseudomonadota bacterium]